MKFCVGYIPTPEFWTLLTLVATGIGHWWWQVSKDRKARLERLDEREEDRKDLIAAAIAAARLNGETLVPVIEQLQKIDSNGTNRLKAMISSNVTTRGLIKESIKASNLAVETSNGIKRDLQENGVRLIVETTPAP